MTLNIKQIVKLDGIKRDSPKYAGVFQKAMEGKASPRAAIKAMCLDCCGLEREVIKNCPATLCPIHAYRPYTGKEVPETAA